MQEYDIERECGNCFQSFPLTEKYWYRRSESNAFRGWCKVCYISIKISREWGSPSPYKKGTKRRQRLQEYFTAIVDSKGNIKLIAARVGCNYMNVYKYARRHVEVRDAIDRERNKVSRPLLNKDANIRND